MSYMFADAEIGGERGRLTDLSENYVVIRDVDAPFAVGRPCGVTIFIRLMGRRVPVKLTGEVVQVWERAVLVMFARPTRNWKRILRSLGAPVPSRAEAGLRVGRPDNRHRVQAAT